VVVILTLKQLVENWTDYVQKEQIETDERYQLDATIYLLL